MHLEDCLTLKTASCTHLEDCLTLKTASCMHAP
jgi:hypothetical protein